MKKALLALLLLCCSTASFAAYRGGANQTNTTSATTVTVTVSGIGIQSGDVVLAFISAGGGTSSTFSETGFSTISGVSNIGISALNNTTGVLCKVAGSSEPSSYTFTSTGTSDLISAQVRVYSGRSGCTADTAATTAPSSSTSPVANPLTGLTPTAGDDLVALWVAGYYSGVSESYATSSGWGNGVLAWAATSFVPTVASQDLVNAPNSATGATGGTVTIGTTNIPYAGYVLALAAASSGCKFCGFFSSRTNEPLWQRTVSLEAMAR